MVLRSTRDNSESVKKIAISGILTALVVVLQMMGQFIKFGPFAISLVLIPIVLGAALCGPKVSTWLGFVFGVAVLFTDAGAFLAISVFGTVVTVLLIACLVAVTGIVCWFVVSYLPMHFASRNMVSTIVGVMDFSSYVGAAVMSGTLGGLLLRYGWPVLPLIWLILSGMSLLLLLGGAGACLKRKGAPRLPNPATLHK